MCQIKYLNCFGCLSSDRKIIQIENINVLECFQQILKDAAAPPEDQANEPVLCWECAALLLRFYKFKQQVTESYKSLCDHKFKILNVIKPQIRLKTHELFNVNYKPEDSLDFHVEVIKTEIDIDDDNADIKIENDSYSDEPLIEITKKRKKKKVVNKQQKKNIEIEYVVIELNENELNEERKNLANQDNYINAMFKCEKCIVSFPNADDLGDHINNKHEKNSIHPTLKCKICERTFSSEVSYNYHMNGHTRRCECVVCGERFTSKRLAVRHYNMLHRFGTEVELDEKTEEQSKDQSAKSQSVFSCEFCPKAFTWRTSLRKHMETHRIESGQKRRPYCEPCKLSFRTTSNLQKHVKTSSKHQIQLKIWKLKELLPEGSSNPEKQQAHMEEIRSAVMMKREQFPCSQCGKKFQWRGNLQRHMKSHAAKAKGELVCTPCDRTFSSIATYRQHLAISKKHVSEEDFKFMCSECGKRFASKTRLKDHIDWEHLKNYVHTCQDCQKVFKSHTSLYLHKQVVHKKDTCQHLCDHCGKPFPNQAKLRVHITAVHSGSAGYRCSACGARFAWHSCLSRHVRRVHRKKPPH